MKLRTSIIALLCVGALSGAGYAGGTVNEFTLSNGLKVIHKEVRKNPLVTIELFEKGGAIEEKEPQAGLASFTQSLLLQGTTHRNAEQLAQEVEDIGGNISQDMEHDYASVGISVMTSHLDKAAELLADIVMNPSFPKEEIEKERVNVLAAIKSRKDQIHNVANDLFNKTFYGNHPYSWPDIGTAESVAKFTREDVIAWHKDHYTVKNFFMVVAGDITAEQAKSVCEKYFSRLPQGTEPPVFPKAEVPPARKVEEQSRKFQQSYLMIGYPAPSLYSQDFPVLKVVNALLGGRMSGRLFVELREKLSLGYEVNSVYPTRRELSRFIVYLGLQGGNLELAKKRIKELMNDLRTTPVTESELKETKEFIRGIYLLDHQTVGRQAWYLGWWESSGKGYQYDEKYLNELMSVTAADIQRVAQKYFTDDYVQVEIVPAKMPVKK